MKKIFFTILISITLFTNSSFAKGCTITISIPNGSCFSYPDNTNDACKVDTFFNVGDTINLPVEIALAGFGCIITDIHWSSGNIVLYTDSSGVGYHSTIKDTGVYILSATNYDETFEYTGTVNDTISVHYRFLTPVNEAINPNAFQIYPSVSSGIFHIKAEGQYELKRISVYDAMGRVVFVSTYNESEINLDDFSNGVYLYAIEDTKERIYRGKIIKD